CCICMTSPPEGHMAIHIRRREFIGALGGAATTGRLAVIRISISGRLDCCSGPVRYIAGRRGGCVCGGQLFGSSFYQDRRSPPLPLQRDRLGQFTLETGAEAHSRTTKQVHFLTAQPKMDTEMG